MGFRSQSGATAMGPGMLTSLPTAVSRRRGVALAWRKAWAWSLLRRQILKARGRAIRFLRATSDVSAGARVEGKVADDRAQGAW